jgi:curved DNA-binding protein CbpA
MEDCYKILGVAMDADNNELKRAYFSKVKIFTPEKNPEEFKRLNSAYQTLLDEKKRAKLDCYCNTPEKTKEKLLEASSLIEDGKYEEALKILSKRGKKHLEVEKMIVEVELELGKLDEAAWLAEKLADNNRSNQSVQILLAGIYEEQGLLIAADKQYERALSINESNDDAWIAYMNFLFVNDPDKCLKLFERIKKLGGEFLKNHTEYCFIYIGLYNKAVGAEDKYMDDFFVECYDIYANGVRASKNEKSIRKSASMFLTYSKSIKLYETNKALVDFISLNFPKLKEACLDLMKITLKFTEPRTMKDMHKVLINLSIILNVGITSVGDRCMRHIYEAYIFEHVDELLPYIARLEEHYPKMYELDKKFYQSLRNPKESRHIRQNFTKESYLLKRKNPQFFNKVSENTVFEDSPAMCLASNEELQHIYQSYMNEHLVDTMLYGKDESYIQALESFFIEHFNTSHQLDDDDLENSDIEEEDDDIFEVADFVGQPAKVVHASYSEYGSTYRREGRKIGRNDPCPCGSSKKYKHCCGKNA